MTKAILMMILMSCVALATPQLKPTQKLADLYVHKVELESSFPRQFADWHEIEEGVGLVNPEALSVIKNIYAQTLSRTYENTRGERVMLSLAYGEDQSDEVGIHLPEGCYGGQGFRIDAKQPLVWNFHQKEMDVTRLLAVRSERIEPITYWLRTGDYVVKPGWKTKWIKMQYAFHGQIPDGMLVRVSNLVSDTNSQTLTHAYEVQEDFLRKLAIHTKPVVQEWLLGQANSASPQ